MNNEIRFFAAANGYDGFRSYFDSVFNSADFEKIYVLKGGPGTGKSSFMKAIKKEMQAIGCSCESIYCSSDPMSLDGVICEYGDKKIAILDGTTPHERDAIIPGSIDEIVNLGDAWDTEWLTAEKDKILDLNKEKKNAYKTAYSYLKICGSTVKQKEFLMAIARNSKKLKIGQKSKAETKTKIRLVSSFGKYGSYRFDTLEKLSEKIFSVIGEDIYAYKLMNEIYENLKNNGGEIIQCPSPFDKNKTEALYHTESKTAYVIGGNGEKIQAEKYFTVKDKTDAERIRVLEEIYNSSIKESERWFNIASDMHFRLEDIYSRAMNFDINNKILGEKLSIIKSYLGL